MITRSIKTLADINLEEKKYELAITAYSDEIKNNSLDYTTYNNRGLSYYYLKQYQLALNDYTKAIEINPCDRIYRNRCLVLYMLENYDDSMQDANKLLELNPNDSDAYDKLGEIYHTKNQLKIAIQMFSKSISIDNKNIYAYTFLADCHFKLEQYEECIKNCDVVINIDPSFMDGLAYRLRGCSHASHKKKYLSFDVDSSTGHHYQSELQKYDVGLALFKNTKIDSETQIEIRIEWRGNHEQAIIDLTEYIKLTRDNKAQGYMLRGICYGHLENYPLAIKDFEMVIKINPDNSEAYKNYGITLAKQKKFNLVIPYLPYISEIDCKSISKDAHFNEDLLLKNARYLKKLIDSYSLTLSDLQALQTLNEFHRRWLTQTWRQLALKKDIDNESVKIEHEWNFFPPEVWDLISSFLIGLDADVIRTKKIRDIESQWLRNAVDKNGAEKKNSTTSKGLSIFHQADPIKAKDAESRYLRRINF